MRLGNQLQSVSETSLVTASALEATGQVLAFLEERVWAPDPN